MTVQAAAPAANAGHSLHREIEAARVLLASYRDILGDDAQAQADAVEGETDLHEALRPALVRLAEIDAMCAGIKSMTDHLGARKSRLEEQAKTLRVLLLAAMDVAGLKRFEADIATLTRKPTPKSVVTTDEAAIPSQFWKRGDPKLDKVALLAALKAADESGEPIPGAELSNGGETVQIKWS